MSGSGNIGNISPSSPTPISATVRKVLNIKIRRRVAQKANSREIILAVFHGIRRKRWSGDLCARSEPRQVARRVHTRAYVSPLKEHARARGGGGEGITRRRNRFMCELASTDHPFFSFELPFHLSSSSLSRLIAVFRASDPSAPLISSTRLPFFLRPSAIRTRQRGNTRAIYPVFENASENPDVSCQWELIRHSRGISYESCVNNTKRRGKEGGRD